MSELQVPMPRLLPMAVDAKHLKVGRIIVERLSVDVVNMQITGPFFERPAAHLTDPASGGPDIAGHPTPILGVSYGWRGLVSMPRLLLR